MTKNVNSNPFTLAKENNLSTFSLFLLNHFTFGLFLPSRISKISCIINSLSENEFYKIKHDFIEYVIKTMILFYFMIFCSFFEYLKMKTEPYYNNYSYIIWIERFLLIAYIVSIIIKILLIIWSFNAKKCLEFYCLKELKFPLKINSFLIIIFGVYYINYCINNVGYKYESFKLMNE